MAKMFCLSPASQEESIRQFQNEGDEQKNMSGLKKKKEKKDILEKIW